ncbi:DUF1641 domain-containing protein [Polycladomyces subterraneus]|uniref:DUF1641 domain-containing protein n=1 Tax=Polycladomyces subterraneus TaxID=1016997 RepID=A0ABT8IQG7_9BACL|nr:DUF1641 domain-containing protein [Polycladomyces subterraneus]MDN4595002.1 DUF1641 domain-containing protein [Polycladomyces subterraneus]
MAAPTKEIVSNRNTAAEEKLSPEAVQLLNRWAERKEAVNELIDVIGLLHEKGWLRTAKAFLASTDELMSIALDQLNTPGGKRFLRNLIHMGVLLSAVDLPSAVKAAEEADQETDRSGMWTLLQTLRDPEVIAAIRFFLNIAKRIRPDDVSGAGEETR